MRGICAIAKSTKKLTEIGRFGIGGQGQAVLAAIERVLQGQKPTLTS